VIAVATRRSTTTVSTKGQVILPAALRARRAWPPGTRLVVEETADGVLLRAAPTFDPSVVDDVFGCLRREGRALTIEEMDAAIAEEAARRHGRD
jgi:AbrB family looped-hinge helix DNA binding protein